MSKAKPPNVSGVALVDKPAGCTSHDVVQQLRRVFKQRQVGHTGTLDPAATGLMLVTLGRATRIGRFLEAADKTYEGTVQLGTSTTTWDAEGEALETVSMSSPPDQTQVESVLSRLVGEVEQVVPAYSAVKVDGERLHKKARRGETVEGPKRRVMLYELELLGIRGTSLDIRARVSKGTYIRSLAVRIGQELGVPAHLSRLRRTRVGPHTVEDALGPDRFLMDSTHILPANEALSHLPCVQLSIHQTSDVAYGRRPRQIKMHAPLTRLVDPQGQLVAVGHPIKEEPHRFMFDVVLIRPEDLAGTV